jgi:hypothetical protein
MIDAAALSIDARLLQFERRETRALQKRTRFIGIDLERDARAMRRIDRRGGGADAGRRERARIAVREHAASFADERHAMLAVAFAQRPIFFVYPLRFIDERLVERRGIVRIDIA